MAHGAEAASLKNRRGILTGEVPLLVVEHTLDGDDVRSVSRGPADGGHDGDQDVLLDGEWARVETSTKDLDVREDTSGKSTDGESDQLGDQVAD